MFIKSYLYLFFLSCALLVSSYPLEQEIATRELDLTATDLKREISEPGVSSLVRKMVDAEAYVRSLFRKRSKHKAAKQIKALKKQVKVAKVAIKQEKAKNKIIQKIADAQGKKAQKSAAKQQGKGAKKAIVKPGVKAKNNKKKSAALTLQPSSAAVLGKAILVLGGGALMVL